MAALFGLRSSEGNLVITRVAPIDHIATEAAIHLDNGGNSIRKSKMSALRKQEDWIGTIHSHCHRENDPCCQHLSDCDIQSAVSYGEAVCGLVYVYAEGTRTDVHWYIPNPLPEVLYVRELPGA